MKKVLILLAGIIGLSFSTNLLAKGKDIYDGFVELNLHEADKFGFLQDNLKKMPNGAELLSKHIKIFSDNTCSKPLDKEEIKELIKKTEHELRLAGDLIYPGKVPQKIIYTYEYDGKKMARTLTYYCK